jgi:hypothetical protein
MREDNEMPWGEILEKLPFELKKNYETSYEIKISYPIKKKSSKPFYEGLKQYKRKR